MNKLLREYLNYRLIFLFSAFLVCVALAVVVNVIYGIDIVYTHLFYVPISLTGIWYPRYAVFLAAALGLIHITCDYTTGETFKIGTLIRTVMFMVVAYVISYLTMRRDRLLNSLRESRESEERYRELSIIDGLTQLYNSRYFYHQLKMEIDRATRYQDQPLTLTLSDLDDFKAFNDTYGHVEGDKVLLRLGQVVKRCLRQTDSAYRYGGEEFTILLPMTTSADGFVTAERIRTEFKKENFPLVSDINVHLTVSIGLAQYKPQEDMEAFVHRVDQLMYQAKKNGKDRVCAES